MGGSQNRDYIKNQYIPRLTEERMSLYSSINQGIYGHVVRAWGGVPVYSSVTCNQGIYSNIFIG
jgi:hypothetical protein